MEAEHAVHIQIDFYTYNIVILSFTYRIPLTALMRQGFARMISQIIYCNEFLKIIVQLVLNAIWCQIYSIKSHLNLWVAQVSGTFLENFVRALGDRDKVLRGCRHTNGSCTNATADTAGLSSDGTVFGWRFITTVCDCCTGAQCMREDLNVFIICININLIITF